MIKSMTGYGSAKGVVDGLEISIELKSVNNRYLDASIRLPRSFLFAEDAVIRVGCFDTKFYVFHEVRTEHDIDALDLRGAGGTNFTAAISAFTGDAENQIIFTDGYAEMPEQRCDCIWVVYGTNPIHPNGGRVLYAKPPEAKDKVEINFLIT
jgi:predicted metal-dependent peptidase